MKRTLVVALLAMNAVATTPAVATMLYKSVSPNGTVMFSDVPPPSDARILEERAIPDNRANTGSPITNVSAVSTMASMESMFDDGAIGRANAQVDAAERALAEARRGTWAPVEGLRLTGSRRTPTDEERIEYYKKNVQIARQYLMDLLRERKLASR